MTTTTKTIMSSIYLFENISSPNLEFISFDERLSDENRMFKTIVTDSNDSATINGAAMSGMNGGWPEGGGWGGGGGGGGVVPLYLKILASIFYSLSIVLGVGGNTLVVLVVIYFRRIRNVTNFFILSLAISDLIFVLLW